MSNETEYLSHFWWKEFYEVREGRSSAYCKLCQMLNDQVIIRSQIIITDIRSVIFGILVLKRFLLKKIRKRF